MVSKVTLVLLLACSATVFAANPDSKLQKRADGLISSLMSFTGYLTKTAVDKGVGLGHWTVDGVKGMIDYGADSMKSVASTLLRRDLNYPSINGMLTTAQKQADESYRTALNLARTMRPGLSDRGQDVLDMYMTEIRDARNHYASALSNAAASAADLNSRLASSGLVDNDDLVNMLQDQYSIEMVNYGNQIRRLGKVLNNNGLDI